MGVEDYIPMGGAALLGVAVAKAYVSEFRRRDQFRNYLERFMTAESEEKPVKADEQLGDLGLLTRVYWDEDVNGYKTGENRPVDLKPLKTVPLNFHWGWGWGSTLQQGLKSHIQEEGIKLGADAYFLSHMVSGHGNPMYALAYFKQEKKS